MKINDKYLINQQDVDIAALKDALAGLKLSGTSDMVEEYEDKLAKYFGSKYAVAVSSGTAALHASLYVAGVRYGDDVVIPATSTLPTAMPIITAGANPIVVDIEKNGIGIDLEDLSKKITPKTKAIIQLPLWGYPLDNRKLKAFCNERNIYLIEDAAQAHGAKFMGQYTGTFGDFGCFSTHDRKILSTGEGGFVLLQDEELYKQVKQFSQLGFMDGKTYGVNYKLSTLQAALGLARIEQIGSQVQRKNEHAKRVIEGLSDTEIVPLSFDSSSLSNYYSLVVMLPWSKEKNRQFISEIAEEGIASDITSYKYCPIYERKLFEYSKTECPNMTFFIDHMTTIPIRTDFSEEEINYIIETYVEKYFAFSKES